MPPRTVRAAGVAAAGLLAFGFASAPALADSEEGGPADSSLGPVTATEPEVLPAEVVPEDVLEPVQAILQDDPPPDDPPPDDPPGEDPPGEDPPGEEPPGEEPPGEDPPGEEPPGEEPPGGDAVSPPSGGGESTVVVEVEVPAAQTASAPQSSAGEQLPVTGPELNTLVAGGVALTGLGAAAAFATRRRPQAI